MVSEDIEGTSGTACDHGLTYFTGVCRRVKKRKREEEKKKQHALANVIASNACAKLAHDEKP